ncbi:MAG: hypothetical protein COZ37_05950 [bacterium (Candidatus Ratteibacteria) CG_4_10_14_3_um_filter_41_18]|uniref:Uncharacterized protein n=4 Tax=Candidatus Ratteibacteria TaxID=2979319 RepID=A0A2M7E924_9BACT|nr:MAG: hypothetical protein COS11_03460 [bacterium (Candidatus Ratteibacteria) CG01_land_8_20_14_3_00_40_19]PIW32968.1 MAG: hypothetical protein COW28_04870 [bacterium (Candidatus Ratteibacteria) CG15_BIG_FIL_POST_REV_8_21_14_020_41_12]PIX76809.1 MAG: hypothetical protein COZ37_05950 [bacterium (Candidatus Ratteibacteria) CG_4_10_14_3_um_filter_41_18]PJA62197.1 MAG: hypothetical protein CO162_02385 [bacterium (Candidatus Ratteibacteria) CG_4_9_14_3_um_filter_41_21]HCG77416.1 hypothetical prote
MSNLELETTQWLSSRDVVCRSLLLSLFRSGLINLPPYLRANYHNRNRNRTPRIFTPKTSISTEPLLGKIKDYPCLSLKLVVKRSPDESLWNYLVHKYHYQGYRFIIGSHLKYIAYLENRPIACLGWGSATWSIKSRDQFIGWSAFS